MIYFPNGPGLCHFMNFCFLSQEAQAAWVQAIGSVLALAIAVAIPFLEGRLRERRLRGQARSLALLVMNDIVEVRDRMDLVLNNNGVRFT